MTHFVRSTLVAAFLLAPGAVWAAGSDSNDNGTSCHCGKEGKCDKTCECGKEGKCEKGCACKKDGECGAECGCKGKK